VDELTTADAVGGEDVAVGELDGLGEGAVAGVDQACAEDFQGGHVGAYSGGL